MIKRPCCSETSTTVSCSRRVSAAKDFGIRSARLFPHFWMRVFIFIPSHRIYNEDTTLRGQARYRSLNRGGGEAAVHHDVLARYERRGALRGEPDDGTRELRRLAEARHRRVA